MVWGWWSDGGGGGVEEQERNWSLEARSGPGGDGPVRVLLVWGSWALFSFTRGRRPLLSLSTFLFFFSEQRSSNESKMLI